MSHRQRILQTIRNIPMMPHAAVEATIALVDADVDFKQVAEKIRQDPCLAAAVLKRANSAAFAARSKIDNIEDAIKRVGTKQTLNVIASNSVKPYAMAAIEGYELSRGDLWRHCIAAACGAETLAEQLKLPAPKYIFTAALLIDIGKFVMRDVMSGAVQTVIETTEAKQIAFEEAEFAVLGIDHAEAGSELLMHWGLPESLTTVVRWHHAPDQAPPEHALATQLVHVADQLATSCGISTGIEGLRHRVSEKAINDLKITPTMIERAVCGIIDRINALSELTN